MRIRWLPILFGLSVLANLGLALAWFGQALGEGVLVADTQSTFRGMAAEREQLQALRTRFCPGEPAPNRAAILAWDIGARDDARSFEKDGLLWLGTPHGVGLQFSDADRLTGVCLSRTWGTLEDPSLEEQDRSGEFCPMEPLCGSGG